MDHTCFLRKPSVLTPFRRNWSSSRCSVTPNRYVRHRSESSTPSERLHCVSVHHFVLVALLLSQYRVMGPTGVGKTTVSERPHWPPPIILRINQFINDASGSQLRVGIGLESQTYAVELSKQFSLEKSQVTLIDTPGFDDTTRSDAEVLKAIAEFLARM